MVKKPTIETEADRFVHIFSQLMGGRLERHALTISKGEFGVLMFLSEQESGITSTMIQDAMRIGPGGVANLLKTLEKKGFVTKGQDKADRRANSIIITDAGRIAVKERYDQVKRSVMLYMEKIGVEESASLNQTLLKILEISRDIRLPD